MKRYVPIVGGLIVLAILVSWGIVLHVNVAERPELSGTSGTGHTLASRQEGQTSSFQGNYERLPIAFEANIGQIDGRVDFLSRGNGYALFLAPGGMRVRMVRRSGNPRDLGAEKSVGKKIPTQSVWAEVGVEFVGASSRSSPTGLGRLPWESNYFVGNHQRQWCKNVPNYSKVIYKDVYPGVDVLYHGNKAHLEFDFLVAPGTDPQVITLGLRGATQAKIDGNGDLQIGTALGDIRLHSPRIFQGPSRTGQVVQGGYVPRGSNQFAFQIGAYDTTRSIVIDPVLSYSTYLGGESQDQAMSIAVDSAGNSYVTGFTASMNFPTAAALQGTLGGVIDVFVAKLNAEGTALVYSTYLGGVGEDFGQGIAVDGSGNAYVTGRTFSPDFPTTPGALQTAFAGGPLDAFVSSLNVPGDTLVYSTYLGGSGEDLAQAIGVDLAGNAYVTGSTSSVDFPTVDAIQPAHGNGESYDIFVTRFNASGGVAYSTLFGGSDGEFGLGVAVDLAGSAYLTGLTGATLPVTSGAFQTAPAGSDDALVVKISTPVVGPIQSLLEEILAIQSLENAVASFFGSSIERELLAKLDGSVSGLQQAITSINQDRLKQAKNHIGASRNQLNAFMNAVRAQAGKKIPEIAATTWISAAEDIAQDLHVIRDAL